MINRNDEKDLEMVLEKHSDFSSQMLIPLEQWICDACGEVIQNPEDGWLEWKESITPKIKAQGFRIVHHYLASPQSSCYYPDSALISNMHLESYLGTDGLTVLLTKLSQNPFNIEDLSELIDIIRRLHTPYYEEARLYMQRAFEDGYLEDSDRRTLYLQSTLLGLIKRYGGKESNS